MASRNPTSAGNNPLTHVREGMEVYDHEDNYIGSVEEVFFGANADFDDTRGVDAPTVINETGDRRPANFVEALANAFSDDDEVPDELAERLLQQGYLKLDTAGLFASDRYVMPDQIRAVQEEKVYLLVRKDDLVKRS
jgi:hypothetical protein